MSPWSPWSASRPWRTPAGSRKGNITSPPKRYAAASWTICVTGIRSSRRTRPTRTPTWSILAEYVTLEDGTGLVHTAPGHGLEDYGTARSTAWRSTARCSDDGTYRRHGAGVAARPERHGRARRTSTAGLQEHGWLFAQGTITHSYPHYWRSQDPAIFRATEQWFIGVDKELPDTGKTLRQMAMESVERVQLDSPTGARTASPACSKPGPTGASAASELGPADPGLHPAGGQAAADAGIRPAPCRSTSPSMAPTAGSRIRPGSSWATTSRCPKASASTS